ncbi:MAG: 50S ribosomal protein L19e [Nanoarchaeota archaeon]|nr:50S ribosomal protein L19e [Nanoarchaeota archaeon]
MKLAVQKRLAADLLKCSPKRVRLSPDRLSEMKEAITKADVRGLINDGLIIKMPEKGVSRARAKHRADQRRKGLQRGPGKRKGKITAIIPRKTSWIAKIRTQRAFLSLLREKELVDDAGYKNLYRKAKGGFFRNKRHIKIYMQEHNLVLKKEN